MALIQLDSRATDLRFSPDGQSLTVVIPGTGDRSFAVPTGQPLDPESGDRTPSLLGGSGRLPDGGAVLLGGRGPGSLPGRGRTFRDREARDAEARAVEARAALTEFLREWTPERRLLEIDLQQAELKLEAAQKKYERMEQLRDSNAVSATELVEHKLAVRQAELDVARVQTQLELHQSKRTSLEERLSETLNERRDELQRRGELLRTYPVDPAAAEQQPPARPLPQTSSQRQ
jgi:hypothetical protein